MTLSYQVLDHGWDGDSYFPGCGVAYTEFTHVVTGRGYCAREALDDAMDLLAQDEHAPPEADVDHIEQETAGGYALTGACDQDPLCPGEHGDCDCACHNPEWAYRVSIRWALTEHTED
jgi:hypothetical protein